MAFQPWKRTAPGARIPQNEEEAVNALRLLFPGFFLPETSDERRCGSTFSSEREGHCGLDICNISDLTQISLAAEPDTKVSNSHSQSSHHTTPHHTTRCAVPSDTLQDRCDAASWPTGDASFPTGSRSKQSRRIAALAWNRRPDFQPAGGGWIERLRLLKRPRLVILC